MKAAYRNKHGAASPFAQHESERETEYIFTTLRLSTTNAASGMYHLCHITAICKKHAAKPAARALPKVTEKRLRTYNMPCITYDDAVNESLRENAFHAMLTCRSCSYLQKYQSGQVYVTVAKATMSCVQSTPAYERYTAVGGGLQNKLFLYIQLIRCSMHAPQIKQDVISLV